MTAIIGLLDWGDCEECEHCDPVNGGCSARDDEWREKIELDGDCVICGCFRKRDAEIVPESVNTPPGSTCKFCKKPIEDKSCIWFRIRANGVSGNGGCAHISCYNEAIATPSENMTMSFRRKL